MTQLRAAPVKLAVPARSAVVQRAAAAVEVKLDPAAAVAVDVKAQSRSDTDGFLATIFNSLIVEGFRFDASGGEGNVGRNMISKPLFVTVPGARDQLAVHLNFMVRPSLRGRRLTLVIAHFHLTARPKMGQAGIDSHGPSILTAGDSIHINRNTPWGRPKNFTELATALGVSGAVILNTLTNVEGYNQGYMSYLVRKLQEAVVQTVGVNMGETEIVFEGDRTWTG